MSSRENKEPNAIEYEPSNKSEDGYRFNRGRWVRHILKIIIGVLLYKILSDGAPYLKSFIKNLS
jgi:hypothetical protein